MMRDREVKKICGEIHKWSLQRYGSGDDDGFGAKRLALLVALCEKLGDIIRARKVRRPVGEYMVSLIEYGMLVDPGLSDIISAVLCSGRTNLDTMWNDEAINNLVVGTCDLCEVESRRIRGDRSYRDPDHYKKNVERCIAYCLGRVKCMAKIMFLGDPIDVLVDTWNDVRDAAEKTTSQLEGVE